jgi:hypothetical protein
MGPLWVLFFFLLFAKGNGSIRVAMLGELAQMFGGGITE